MADQDDLVIKSPPSGPSPKKRAFLTNILNEPALSVKLLAIVSQFLFSFGKVVLGFYCMYLGRVLFENGVTGNVKWKFEAQGIQSDLAHASPGVVLFVAGVLIVLFSTFTITISNKE